MSHFNDSNFEFIYRLHDISFQMDASDSSAPGYDSNCVHVTNPGGLTEDYIMIPKAVVSGTQELKANIFCSNTVSGQEITCNYMQL